MIIPNTVDLTESGRIVRPVKIGELGYMTNDRCELHLIPTESGVEVNYLGESGALLTDDQVQYIIDNYKKFI